MAINPALLVSAAVLQEPILDDATGLPLVGGIVTLYQDASRTTFKNWYYLSGSPGNYSYIPLANPLTLNAAGVITDPNGNDTIPYFYPYSELDNITPQPYYITVTDSGGHSKITRQNFPFNPQNQSVVNTVNATLKNYIINNVFWRNNANGTALNLTNSTAYVLAPSAHQGFTNPDITFSKSSTGATDSITFTAFSAGSFLLPIGSNPQNLDVTPEYFMNFTCAAAGSETSKLVQIPLSLHLKTLDQVPATVTFWARCNSAASGANILTAQIYQYAGSGAVANSVTTKIQAIALPVDSTWHKYTLPLTMPTASGIAIGAGGDDAVFLQFSYAVGGSNTFNIDIAKPCFYIGNQAPTNDMQVYDNQEAIFSSPRTGDVKVSLSGPIFATPYNTLFGYVPMNDGTIGNASSNGTCRANKDTWPLYNLIWGNFQFANVGTANGIAQLYNSSGTPITYGASAIADFNANNAIAITKQLGRTLLGTVPTMISTTQTVQSQFTASNDGSGNLLITLSSPNTTFYKGMPVVFSNSGGTYPGNITNALFYASTILSSTTLYVSTTYANALAGTLIAYSSAGTGIQLINTSVLGAPVGEYAHTQLVAELAAHNHGPGAGTNFQMIGGGGGTTGIGAAGANPATTATTGSSTPFNVVQPSSYLNMFIKL